MASARIGLTMSGGLTLARTASIRIAASISPRPKMVLTVSSRKRGAGQKRRAIALATSVCRRVIPSQHPELMRRHRQTIQRDR